MKNYFSTYYLYKITFHTHGEAGVHDVLAIDSSLIGASVIVHENITKDDEIIFVSKADDNPVIIPLERSNKYKMFKARIEGQWSGQDVYILGSSLSIAAGILDEYCGTYYKVTTFYEMSVRELYVNPNNPEEVEKK